MEVIQRGRSAVRPPTFPPLSVVPAVSDSELSEHEYVHRFLPSLPPAPLRRVGNVLILPLIFSFVGFIPASPLMEADGQQSEGLFKLRQRSSNLPLCSFSEASSASTV